MFKKVSFLIPEKELQELQAEYNKVKTAMAAPGAAGPGSEHALPDYDASAFGFVNITGTSRFNFALLPEEEYESEDEYSDEDEGGEGMEADKEEEEEEEGEEGEEEIKQGEMAGEILGEPQELQPGYEGSKPDAAGEEAGEQVVKS